MNAVSAVDTDLDLYRRGVATAVACWTSYARAIPGAAVHRLPHVDIAVFTDGPERDVFNNAVLAHGLADVDAGTWAGYSRVLKLCTRARASVTWAGSSSWLRHLPGRRTPETVG